jgi:predicted N-formylglutamate amidohydrolase
MLTIEQDEGLTVESFPANTLLGEDDPPPFRATPGSVTSPFVITCDHAGNRLPRSLGTLGLSSTELASHIAWDIGAARVSAKLAAALNAFLIVQTYSRLVIDCNRPLDAPSSIARQSELTVVPGNQSVSPADAEMRARAVFHPYHECIRQELDRREAQRQPAIFVAMHTFTPRFLGLARPWHAGVLYNRDPRLGRALLALLRCDNALIVGDNEPYSVSDLTDYGLIHYGERRGIPHVEIEIRQDLVSDDAGQAAWSERLATLLREASKTFL